MYEIFNRKRSEPLVAIKGNYYRHVKEDYFFFVLGFVEDYCSIEVRISTNPGERVFLSSKDRNYVPATREEWRLACAKTSSYRIIEQCYRILNDNRDGKILDNPRFVERLHADMDQLSASLDNTPIEIHPDKDDTYTPGPDELVVTEFTALVACPN